MFDNVFFQSIIALATLYLVFSQLTLSLIELPAGFLNWRGRYLYHHLQEALGPTLGPALYEAPAIEALMPPVQQKNWLMRLLRVARWPAYISEPLFAQSIIAQVRKLAPAPASSPFAQFQAGLVALSAQTPAPNFAKVLANYTDAAMAAAGPNPEELLQKSLEAWFHEYGERMTGWYKRDQRWPLFWAGLLVAVLADVDTVRLARFIFDAGNAKARLAVVADGVKRIQATAPAVAPYNPANQPPAGAPPPATTLGPLLDAASQEFQKTLASVPEAGLPLGWLRWANTEVDTVRGQDAITKKMVPKIPLTYEWAPTADDYQLPVYAQRWTLNPQTGQVGHAPRWSWWLPVGGWLLTAFALMLGAPFWFDTLCRFVNIRNIGIKPAKAAGNT